MDEAVKKIYKELLQINRKGVFDNTATIEPYDIDSPLTLKVVLTPTEGYYAGSAIEFKMTLTSGYPKSGVPTFKCMNKVYHPNIK
jgi:ubiquitin-protein ligase